MKYLIALILFLSGLAQANYILDHDGNRVFIPKEPEQTSCVNLESNTGKIGVLDIKTDFPGRYTVGDVDNDGRPDIVVSQRNRIAAYNVCGKKLLS